MPSSAVIVDGTVLSILLEIDEVPAPADHQIISIETWSSLNRIGRAQIIVQDESPSGDCFIISSSKAYLPGAKVKISLGYDAANCLVFSGIIISHGLEFGVGVSPRVMIEVADPAIAMTLGRRSELYADITDRQLIEQLLSAYKLNGSVSDTTIKQPVIVQHACSDWDLMLMRADSNGFVVASERDSIRIAPPQTKEEPKLELVYGESILEAHLRLDASTQVPAAAVQALAWDPANLAVARSSEANTEVQELGNLSSSQLAAVLACNQLVQQSAASLSAAELSQWADVSLQRHQLAKVRGQLRCQGTADARIDSTVRVIGLGDRFHGNAYISGVHHRVDQGEWTTELEIGLSAESYAASTYNISSPPAAGQLAAAGLIQIGLVTKVADDPDQQYRLQIQLPLVQKDNNLIWARLAHPYASAECGFQFLPEVGDEVLVAFMEGDPRFPVVLGSLYSKKHAPAQAPTAENNLKSLVTKAKLRLDFDEEAKAIRLTTPAKQMLTIDDKAKQLKLEDCNGNSISLSDSGIILNSSGDIKLEAKGSIQLSANTNLTAKGGTKLELSAPQGEFNADSQLTLKGGAQAQLTAGASVVVQAAMVKIN
ncbi:MAG: type VI secretion system tip protein VgrG [Synechococcaceae cyanobacterium]